MSNANVLYLRCFFPGDDKIVQKWRDEFPFKDGTEGTQVELPEEVYCDGIHTLLILRDVDGVDHPIGSFCFTSNNGEIQVKYGIGDFKYRGQKNAIESLIRRYFKVFYGDSMISIHEVR